MEKNKKSFSKTYQKGYSIVDDALIFIDDTLSHVTEQKGSFDKGERVLTNKIRITITILDQK